MKLCYSWMPELVLLVFVLLKVGLVSGAADKTEIRNYLTKIIDDEESWTKKTLNRDEILRRYTENTEKVKWLKYKVTFTDVIQLHISLAKKSAVLKLDAACSVATQDVFHFIVGVGMKVHQSFQTLANDGRQYCNFFKYLVCEDAPAATKPGPKCVCPITMVWQGDSCVFKVGQVCMKGNSGLTDPENSAYSDVRFYLWDFNLERYSLQMPSRCVASSRCQPDTNICEEKSSFKLFPMVPQLADFLKKRFEADNPGHSSGHELTEAISKTLVDIEKPYRLSDYYFLSLEYEMEQRLLERGRPCDDSKNDHFDKICQAYGSIRGFWEDFDQTNSYDGSRREIQRKVLDSGVNPCNYFKFLRCKSGTCDCRDGMEFEGGICKSKHNFACETMKLFQFKLQVNYRDEKTIYFKHIDPECTVGSMCTGLGDFKAKKICLKENDWSLLQELLMKFKNKFSIAVNGACNVHHHEELFKLDGEKSYSESKKIIEDLVANSAVQYCDLYQHLACASDGKCTCIPPTSPVIGVCTVSIHERCDNSAELDRQRKILDSLVKPLKPSNNWSEFFCHGGSSCETLRPRSPLRFCLCSNSEYVDGEVCMKGSRKHPAFELIQEVSDCMPADMTSIDGRKLLSSLHTEMYKVEQGSLGFGASCDAMSHTKLQDVMNYLQRILNGCSRRTCETNCESLPELQLRSLKGLLVLVEKLVPLRPFCNFNAQLQCSDGTCNCHPEWYYGMDHSKCFLDLGHDCISESHFIAGECRPGLYCSKENICELAEWQIVEVSPYEAGRKLPVPEYVFRVKQSMIQFLEEEDKRLNIEEHRVLKEFQDCSGSEQKEKDFNNVKAEIQPAVKMAKTGANLQENRQHVRILQKVVDSVIKLRLIRFCAAKFSCDSKTNRCSKVIPLPPPLDPKPKPIMPGKEKGKGNSASASLLVNLKLIFVSVLLYVCFMFS